ncbi:MAG: Cna B-type domain-containing protein, partial [Clostridia bacterium]|nr:Cna B-type domain-containing protein [Clostridia bacterium]
MKKKIISMLICLAMCLSLLQTAVNSATNDSESFVIERVPGGTQKDVIVKGERRVIYCMQYDYLWPVTDKGYANPQTVYTEAQSVDLLTPDEQLVIHRILYAGYPYDSVGALAPLYANLDAASASEAAANMTQGIIWSYMVEWKVAGNTHYSTEKDTDTSDIPGWDEAYAALIDYAENGSPVSTVSENFTPEINGSTTLVKNGDVWMSGALSITNPEGFKVMYNVSVPDDVCVLDEDGYMLFPNWDFVDGEWVNYGYTVYGGDTFYLQSENGPEVKGQSVEITGSVKIPTDIKQYVTNETGLGNKNDGQGYVRHNFQTMLSIGMDTREYSVSAVLDAAEETIDVIGHKTWIHGDNPEEFRPAEITVHLHANGVLSQTLTVRPDEEGHWSWTFTGLPKYDESGAEIIYTVDEGYVHNYSASYQGYSITNTYSPSKTSINIEKIWNDEADHDGFRPSSVTVKLFADGKDTGKTVVLTAEENWRGVFADLDERTDDGSENGRVIVYTVEEVPVDGYSSECEVQTDNEGNEVGFIITNTHLPEHITVCGEKTWIHGNNPVDMRPESITVFLHADGIVKDVKTVTANDGWKWSFEGLDKFSHGREIVYTVTEANVPNYLTTYDRESFDITNTYAPEKTSVSVSKIWNDDNDRDGIRPESVVIRLLKNLVPTDITLTLDETNRWEGVFENLNVSDEDGNAIHYSVIEENSDGYKSAVTGSQSSGFTVTSTHTAETVDISGKKIWNDSDNRDGLRPDSITIHLLADGVVKDTVNVTEADGWKWSFTGWHKYENGEEIVYSILEESIDGYESEYDDFDVTNTHETEKTSVNVKKIWEDGDNRDGIRPDVISVNVIKDGVTVASLELNANNRWEARIDGLDKYENGQLIEYKVAEEAADGYESKVEGSIDDGFVITNTHETEKTSVNVKKIWED